MGLELLIELWVHPWLNTYPRAPTPKLHPTPDFPPTPDTSIIVSVTSSISGHASTYSTLSIETMCTLHIWLPSPSISKTLITVQQCGLLLLDTPHRPQTLNTSLWANHTMPHYFFVHVFFQASVCNISKAPWIWHKYDTVKLVQNSEAKSVERC